MTPDEAAAFIHPAVAAHTGDWADLGVGAGTFTAALAQLFGAPHTVTAVERDASALKQLHELAASRAAHAAAVRVIVADLADATSLDVIPPESQAGILFGNVLHYFADPLPLLRAARTKLNDNGAVVVLEYEGARANPWVPHPLPLRRLSEFADAAQLVTPDVVSETTSRYQGTLYCAVLRR
jgi:SAM-dependent methyltransferase